MATRFIKGNKKTLNKGDYILLSQEMAKSLVERGALIEVNPVKVISDEIMQAGGRIIIRSSILRDKISFCTSENGSGEITCYTAEELAAILLKNPDPETLKLIHEIKKIFSAKIILR